MTREYIVDEYFCWMYDLVFDRRYSGKHSYRSLLLYLYNTDFNYILEMDGNRAEDGICLRYRFADEFRVPQPAAATYLDSKPCSVLEMMVALALRCEEHIMGDPDYGDRVGRWFWEMIESLGLANMSDGAVDYTKTNDILQVFMIRKYKSNGQGGLFTIHNNQVDMRKEEIWYQMHWYLDEVVDL